MPPFAILHVCVGNICRSPMAERLLALALARRVGPDAAIRCYVSHGAGTGSWHIGDPMNPPAARQVVARGGNANGFTARKLSAALIDSSDLILCATSEQVTRVLDLRASAAGKTFVLGEFGRLLAGVDLSHLPAVSPAAEKAYERGLALVGSVDAARSDAGSRPGRPGRPRPADSPALEGEARVRRPSRFSDDLPDPWGLPDREFARVADTIEATVGPLADALAGDLP
jgi:protein-tyrosine phosphatase